MRLPMPLEYLRHRRMGPVFDLGVEIDMRPAQQFCSGAADCGLARAGKSDQNNVRQRDAIWSMYPSRLRLISRNESPPNFSIAACATTKASIASAITPLQERR